ncbi:hypothetical protein L1887_61879 [Cichorium endivia]|nr:hypothetical protein L1887_61879 [Cichorium endivia]
MEGDGSVTRKDHYFGNSWDADPQLVAQFINETNTYGNGNVDVISLAHSRYRAWDSSRQNNPDFDFNPWRMLVAYGESGFVHEALRGSSAKFDECMIRSLVPPRALPRRLEQATRTCIHARDPCLGRHHRACQTDPPRLERGQEGLSVRQAMLYWDSSRPPSLICSATLASTALARRSSARSTLPACIACSDHH